MSRDYYASVIVGCYVDADELFDGELVPMCDHKPPEDAKYCSVCGRENRMYVQKVELFTYDEKTGRPLFCGLDVVFDTGRVKAVVGELLGSVSDYGTAGCTVPNMQVIRERVQPVLEKEELWNEHTFGLWCVLGYEY